MLDAADFGHTSLEALLYLLTGSVEFSMMSFKLSHAAVFGPTFLEALLYVPPSLLALRISIPTNKFYLLHSTVFAATSLEALLYLPTLSGTGSLELLYLPIRFICCMQPF